MGPHEVMSAVLVVMVLVLLLMAAREDICRREVRDIYWAIIGIVGSTLYTARCFAAGGVNWEYTANMASAVSAFSALMWGNKYQTVTLISISISLMVMVLVCGDGRYGVVEGAVVPLFMLLFTFAYMSRIVRGGADCKCLISMSMAFPMYPGISGLPLLGEGRSLFHVFSLSVSVLFVAAVMTVIAYAVWSVLVKRRSGGELRGYPMDVNDAENSFVWPLEDVIDGQLVYVGTPDDDDLPEIYDRLRDAGVAEVYVTPMVPFIAAIAMAFVFVVIVGSPLSLI